MLLTRKIELWIKEDNKDLRNEIWRTLRDYENMVFRGSNLVSTNKLFNETFNDRIILTDEELSVKKEKIDNKIQKLTEKLRNEDDEKRKKKIIADRKKQYSYLNQLTSEARKMAEEFYTTSDGNSLYQMLTKKFPNLPAQISSKIEKHVSSDFNNDFIDLKMGKRSLRTYKKGFPTPFPKSSMRFVQDDKEIYMKWYNDIIFKLNFGRDRSNNRIIMERVIKGDYKASDSSIQIKNNKIFLLIVVDLPEGENKLNDDVYVGVDLGLAIPAVCSLNVGLKQLPIGSYNDYIRVRTQLFQRKKRLQRSLTLTKGGKGRTKKLKALDRLKDKERNWAKTYNHTLTNRIVKFAKDNLASVIKLEFLKGYGEDETNSFVLRYWGYFEMQTMIEYKAKREGMKVVYIDPYHTSQICSFCNHYEKGQRLNQSEFLCKNVDCSNKDDKGNNKIEKADWNASKNIALSEKIVTKKEQCEYYKQKRAEKN
jgi:putative transposase